MKCKNCGCTLKLFYYRIANKELCKECSLELLQDIREFKVDLEKGAGKKW